MPASPRLPTAKADHLQQRLRRRESSQVKVCMVDELLAGRLHFSSLRAALNNLLILVIAESPIIFGRFALHHVGI